MSKTQKMLFQKYARQQNKLESQMVGKPEGDLEKPSFVKSMQTTIVGVELEEIAFEEKQIKEEKKEEIKEPVLPLTHDPHNLVQLEQPPPVSEIPQGQEPQSRNSSFSLPDNASQASQNTQSRYSVTRFCRQSDSISSHNLNAAEEVKAKRQQITSDVPADFESASCCMQRCIGRFPCF